MGTLARAQTMMAAQKRFLLAHPQFAKAVATAAFARIDSSDPAQLARYRALPPWLLAAGRARQLLDRVQRGDLGQFSRKVKMAFKDSTPDY